MIKLVFNRLSIALLLLIPPVFEAAFLRVYLHSFLNLRIGWGYFTDYELVLPVPTAFLFYVCFLMQDWQDGFQINWRRFSVNFLTFASFILVNHFYSALLESFSTAFVIVWWALLFSVCASACCLFVPPAFYLKSRSRFVLVPCVLIATCLIWDQIAGQGMWSMVIPLFKTQMSVLVKIILGSSAGSVLVNENMLSLYHPNYTVLIGSGCGGLEGFFLFLYSFSILIVLRAKKLSPFGWVLSFVSGILMMHLLNLGRLLLIFCSAVWLRDYFGFATANWVALSLFHIHAGWVIYLSGITVYWLLVFRMLKAEKSFGVRRPISQRESYT